MVSRHITNPGELGAIQQSTKAKYVWCGNATVIFQSDRKRPRKHHARPGTVRAWYCSTPTSRTLPPCSASAREARAFSRPGPRSAGTSLRHATK
jgi:hypothetical protein